VIVARAVEQLINNYDGSNDINPKADRNATRATSHIFTPPEPTPQRPNVTDRSATIAAPLAPEPSLEEGAAAFTRKSAQFTTVFFSNIDAQKSRMEDMHCVGETKNDHSYDSAELMGDVRYDCTHAALGGMSALATSQSSKTYVVDERENQEDFTELVEAKELTVMSAIYHLSLNTDFRSQ